LKIEELLSQRFDVMCRREGHTVYVRTEQDLYVDVARHLKKEGYTRLLTVSAVDWIEDEEFEIYYLVHSKEDKDYVKVSVRVDRKNPVIPTLSGIWINSEMHEREAWEMFGITFEGNNMLKPLLTEGWKGPPPFRKDFDWREYANIKDDEVV